MCVALPALVVAIGPPAGIARPAVARFVDGERPIDLAMVPDVAVGDHVIVHSGYAIRRVDAADAARTAEITSALGTP